MFSYVYGILYFYICLKNGEKHKYKFCSYLKDDIFFSDLIFVSCLPYWD
jgi:hypothetical protein